MEININNIRRNIKNSIKPIEKDGTFGNISIKRDCDELEIIITNISKDDAEIIKNKIIEKRRRNIVKNKNLGVVISYSSEKMEGFYRLNTTIKIPSFSSSLKESML